jgi:cysteine sulfinate desulfinase/cysteine desulfurase-like protein
LKTMGLSDARAHATIRFSLGRPTTTEEIVEAANMVAGAWERTARPKATATR